MLSLDIALLTDPGGRPYNEDACGHWNSENQLCCVLADGAGGHNGGDIASRHAVEATLQAFSQRPTDDGTALANLLRETNLSLRAQREPGTPRADMHTTIVCLVLNLDDGRAHWAHVGDSRLYWFRGGAMVRRTTDHSIVQSLVDAGLLAPQDLRTHPQRSELRSALGVAQEDLEVGQADLGPGDHVVSGDVFMLCTDGLWEYVDDACLERTLAAAANPQQWLDALAEEVRAACVNRRNHDNFTALAVWAVAA